MFPFTPSTEPKLFESDGIRVLRGRRTPDGKQVLLKALDAGRFGARALRRLRTEFETGQGLGLGTVVEPLGLDTYEGMPVLVLEDFGGDSLSRLQGAPLSVEDFLPLAVRVVQALADLHGRGLVHGSVRPENVLMHPDSGQVKLMGMGMGRASSLAQGLWGSGVWDSDGSLPYQSPEQTGRVRGAIDARSDLYALGMMFFELLTGRMPIKGRDSLEWVHWHLACQPPPLNEVVPSIPSVLSAIILKLCAKQAEDRYQTARGLLHDLERCLAEWRSRKTIAPFSLGERDVLNRFSAPQRLYGRDKEVAELLSGYERVVASGEPELCLLSGEAGVGKSSLVPKLHEPVVRNRGLFASTKFDQYKRGVPYSGLMHAFRQQLMEAIAQGEEQIAVWRERLKEALGPHGQLLIELIPQVELFIGPQPSVPELAAKESENRFHEMFRHFVGLFAKQEHPFTLFLDDLQWADSSSLRLITDLLTHSDIRYLYVVGSYRHNEVEDSHPLRLALNQARDDGARIHTISLKPLREEDVGQLIADAVSQIPQAVAPLTRLVYRRTAGNPFWTVQFLALLHQERLLVFDSLKLAWHWDLRKIEAKGYADNAVELMVQKLGLLPLATQEVVKLAACLGGVADASLLAAIGERSEEQTHKDLEPALNEWLILRDGDAYRFAHDRVQEAAYLGVKQEDRPAVHLRIARLLLSHLPNIAFEERIFEVSNHFGRALSLVTDPAERDSVFELSVVAGRKAKVATAYESARDCWKQAASLLPPEAWDVRHDETLALYLDLSEAEFLIGNFSQAEVLLASVLEHAPSKLDRARVFLLRIRLYSQAGRYEDVARAVIEGLKPFGITFPETEEALRRTTQTELAALRKELGALHIADLADAPLAADPSARMIISLLVESIPAMSLSNPTYFFLFPAKAVRYSLHYGNTPESCYAYVAFASWLTLLDPSTWTDIPTAYALSEMALRLNEKLKDIRLRGRLLLAHAGLICFWRQPFYSCLPIIEQGIAACRETGDNVLASFLSICEIELQIELGESLEKVVESCHKCAEVSKETHNESIYKIIQLTMQFVANLRGQTRHPDTYSDANFDEPAAVAKLSRGAAPGALLTGYHVMKQMSSVVYGHFPEALAAGEQAEVGVTSEPMSVFGISFFLWRALSVLALYPTASDDKKPEMWRTLKSDLQRLEFCVQFHPGNYENRFALAKAELARVEGRDVDAMSLYEEAIHSSRDNGFLSHEALAYEFASRFYRSRGFMRFADSYLLEARSCYARWGADGKVSQIDRLNPQLFKQHPLAPGAEQLDLLAVAKASQTISSKVVPDQLVPALLKVVLEQGGAQTARLAVVHDDGNLWLEAEAGNCERAAAGFKTSLPQLAEKSGDLPTSLIHFVRRTKERVIIADMGVDGGMFAADPYFVQRQPKSVLCLPILREAEVVGLLYLENELVTGAFTADRLASLEVLAAQAAISLQIAQLLSREQAARKTAEKAEKRSAFLAAAGGILAESLNPNEVFQRLADLTVRHLADWVVIDLTNKEQIQHTIACADPQKQPVLDELRHRYPKQKAIPGLRPTVAETGQSLLLPFVSEEQLRSFCEDDLQVQLVQKLGTRSGLAVPLIARGKTLGVIALMSAQPGRYTEADLDLAKELASRAAVAIDNAELYRATQEAVRLREEFLSVASHELKTPLTSLQLTLQKLRRGSDRLTAETLNQSVGRADRQIARLAQLIEEMLEVSRIQEGHFVLHLEELDLGSVVRSITEDLQEDLDRAGCVLTVRETSSISGFWDKHRLEQVLGGLLSNSLKFGLGKPVEVTLEQVPNDMARLTVTDHGIGIPTERLPHIFGRFERAVSSRKYGGLGLGLFVVQNIVQTLGGTVSARSVAGEGATFTVEIPRAGPTIPIPPPQTGWTTT